MKVMFKLHVYLHVEIFSFQLCYFASTVDGRISGNNPIFAFTRMFVVSAVGNGYVINC